MPSAGSVFELEASDEEEDAAKDVAEGKFEPIEPVPPASFFEIIEEDATEEEPLEEASAAPLFEIDDVDDAEDGDSDKPEKPEESEESDGDGDSDPFPVIARPGERLFEVAEEGAADATDAADQGDSSEDEGGGAEEIRVMIDEEEEESEVRSSGPFYF